MFTVSRRRFAAVVSGVLAAALLMPGSAFAVADGEDSAPVDATVANAPFTTESEEISSALGWQGQRVNQDFVKKFDPYVTENSAGKYSLSVPQAVRISDAAGVAKARRMVDEANAVVLHPVSTVASESAASAEVIALRAHHGGIKKHWWGFTLWLDHWATGRLAAGLAAGSGAAWVAAELTSWTGIGGLSAGAIAALLALGGGAILLCDWNDRGVNFHVAPIIGTWCWAR